MGAIKRLIRAYRDFLEIMKDAEMRNDNGK